MSMTAHSAVLVAVMSLVTVLLRFLPFMVFRKKVPAYVAYLGRVLPAAIIGMSLAVLNLTLTASYALGSGGILYSEVPSENSAS